MQQATTYHDMICAHQKLWINMHRGTGALILLLGLYCPVSHEQLNDVQSCTYRTDRIKTYMSIHWGSHRAKCCAAQLVYSEIRESTNYVDPANSLKVCGSYWRIKFTKWQMKYEKLQHAPSPATPTTLRPKFVVHDAGLHLILFWIR